MARNFPTPKMVDAFCNGMILYGEDNNILDDLQPDFEDENVENDSILCREVEVARGWTDGITH